MILKARSGAIAGLVSLMALAAGPALAGPSLVIDVDSGKVLHQQDATAPWYPASVTKLMTAYVALKEVAAGRITMDTPLIVSARASAASPSKMGFKPGIEVTLENALRMIMVKSANDVSVTIAEGIAGSVETFSAMMNREAARLGMVNSNFVNPNGWPDPDNRTSARDMAILGRALLLEFPQHGDLWGIGAIKFGKRIMRNTNGLVGRYPGTLGMKTGFICSSGFNVVAAAERNGRRLIAVVMGAHTAAERTIRTAELLDKGFASMGWSGTTVDALPAGFGTPPDLRPDVCGKRRGIPSEEDGETPVAAGVANDSDNPIAAALQPALTPGVAAVRGTGGRWSLAPRAAVEPTIVSVGRRPGSTAIARGPVGVDAPVVAGVPAGAQAFAPDGTAAKPGTLREGPLLLQGSAPQAPGAGIGFGAKPAPTANRGAIAARPAPDAGAQRPAAKPAPTAAKPAPAKPTAAKPAAAKPAAAKPAPAKPVAARDPSEKPAAKPAPAKPAVDKPAAAKPVAAKPAPPGAKPAAQKPKPKPEAGLDKPMRILPATLPPSKAKPGQ